MAIKLDDFLSKKKEPAQVLDLSKVKITSKDEFRKYFDKIPEYKIKPEKVMPETIKIRDKDFSFTPGRREEKQSHDWSYPDPTPPDMKAVKLEDLCPVNIDWKMLTTLRPKTKVEEDMFSKLVQLGKLDLKYQQFLRREKDTDWVRKTKNPRSSIVETRVLCCKECGEDFCDGSLCNKLMYENFFRVQTSAAAAAGKDGNISEGEDIKKKKKKKQKRKSRKRTRSTVRQRKPRKNSIFNRPASRGCSRDHSRRGSHANIAEKIQAQSAARAASLSRSRSTERRPSVVSFSTRAKSAPRIQFKGEVTSEGAAGPSRMGYTSDSGPSPTDYSSQSDSESPRFRTRSRLKLPGKRKHRSARVGFVEGYQSDTGEYSSRSKFVRECTLLTEYKGYYSDASGMESQDSNDSDSDSPTPSPSRSNSRSPEKYYKAAASTTPKRPSTIQIAFDELTPSSSVYFPAKSYVPSKFVAGSARKSDISSTGTLRNQEVTRIMEGFSKIELAFKEDKASTSQMSGLKTQRSQKTTYPVPKIRPKTSNPTKLPTSYVKGKGLLNRPP